MYALVQVLRELPAKLHVTRLARVQYLEARQRASLHGPPLLHYGTFLKETYQTGNGEPAKARQSNPSLPRA